MAGIAFVAGVGAAYAVTQGNWDASSTATGASVLATGSTGSVATRDSRAPTPKDDRAARFEELKEVAALAANTAPAANEEDLPTSAVTPARDSQASAEANPDERASARPKRTPHRVHVQRRAQPTRRQDPASGDRLVYLYDEVRPNGERVRVYRRAAGRGDTAIAADRGERRGFFEPPWERW